MAGKLVPLRHKDTSRRALDARRRVSESQRAQAARDRQAPGINLPQRSPLNAEGMSRGQFGFSYRRNYQPRA